MILDRKLQFSAKLTKELNKILGIEIKLPILFYLQTGGQTEQMNQKLEQYLYFFVDYKQNNQPEQLATAEFTVNNKIYSATKMSLFMANYRREMGVDIRKKRKVEKTTDFAKRMKKVQEKAGAVLRKA